MFFVDCSSAFNTIIPTVRSVNCPFLVCTLPPAAGSGTQQIVRKLSDLDLDPFSTITVNTGSPQGCVLSTADTAAVGLIPGGESAYRDQVQRL